MQTALVLVVGLICGLVLGFFVGLIVASDAKRQAHDGVLPSDEQVKT